MDNSQLVKDLKKELLELEGNPQESPKERATNNSASGIIMIGVGAVCLAIGIIKEISVSSFSGGIVLIIGFVMIFKSNTSINEFEDKQKEKQARILAIKKALIDLE